MFRFLFRKLNRLHIQCGIKGKKKSNVPCGGARNTKISGDIGKNMTLMKEIFAGNYDVSFREFAIGEKQQIDAFLVFIDGMVEVTTINVNILKPLMIEVRGVNPKDAVDLEWIKKSALTTANLREAVCIEEVAQAILCGDTALFFSITNKALIIDTKAWEKRGVEKPDTETVVRGPKESFSETLKVNTVLLRRKIRSPNLKLERLTLGRQTRTDLCIAYVQGVANARIVSEVRRRLKKIDIDAVLESGYIEEFIEDTTFSLFSTVGNSEKPDTVAAKILEGRVAIFVDGTPTVLTVPQIFFESLIVSEDYYSRPFYTSLLRLIRFLALSITVLLPALYVAVVTFHPELLPTELAISIALASEGVPFPVWAEVILMGLLFEVLREAGVRMPRPIGQAVSIVGALILGDAAIRAGIVGAPVVIVNAITAIASFVLPPQLDAVTLVRLLFVIAAGTMGLPGLFTLAIILIIHMASLRSFGVPYLAPLAPFVPGDWKDLFVRFPWWAMTGRPHILTTAYRRRVAPGQKPDPFTESEDDGSS